VTGALLGALVGLDPWVAVYCLVVVFVGAVIQSSIGFGLGLVAAPALGLADPDFVPVALLVAIAPMALAMAVRERHHVDRRGIGWAVLGRVPGSAFGAWVAARADHTTLAILIGVSVLAAVAASVTGFHFRPSRHNLAMAGVASGFGGTVVGIGGPPMALTYQHSNAPTLRSTLAVFFLVGLMISIVSLAVAGVIAERELKLGLLLVPASLAGTGVGRLAAGHLPEGKVRPLVLGLCAASALALLAEQLL
jgi:uncharacterized membrane protein YfcA